MMFYNVADPGDIGPLADHLMVDVDESRLRPDQIRRICEVAHEGMDYPGVGVTEAVRGYRLVGVEIAVRAVYALESAEARKRHRIRTVR